jgi:hypothetical protein
MTVGERWLGSFERWESPPWTEIATALGVTRQSAWERWHELDETRPQTSDVH